MKTSNTVKETSSYMPEQNFVKLSRSSKLRKNNRYCHRNPKEPQGTQELEKYDVLDKTIEKQANMMNNSNHMDC